MDRLFEGMLFSDQLNGDAGPPFEDTQKQHALRRSICSGWRNKAWHGRLMAMLELLSGETDNIRVADKIGGILTMKSAEGAKRMPFKYYI